jgi:hypothetical protein
LKLCTKTLRTDEQMDLFRCGVKNCEDPVAFTN